MDTPTTDVTDIIESLQNQLDKLRAAVTVLKEQNTTLTDKNIALAYRVLDLEGAKPSPISEPAKTIPEKAPVGLPTKPASRKLTQREAARIIAANNKGRTFRAWEIINAAKALCENPTSFGMCLSRGDFAEYWTWMSHGQYKAVS